MLAPALRAALAALALLLTNLPIRALAVPISAEAEVRASGENLAGARRAALDRALARTVDLVLSRHVSPADRTARRRELASAFLAHPGRYILRYGISSEALTGDVARVEVEAEVDEGRLLAELERRGFSVLSLPVKPRVLVVSPAEPTATLTAQSVRSTLEGAGYLTRVLPGGAEGPLEAAQVADWTRSLGCHVGVVVTAESEMEAPPEPATPEQGEEAQRRPAASVRSEGWIVDGLTGKVLGRAEGQGASPEAVDAREMAPAAARAGRSLAYALIADLEQSGWQPEGELVRLRLRVDDLPAASSVEALQKEIGRTAEIRRLDLMEVGYRSAVWRAEAVTGGLGWDAVLSAVRFPKGRLAYRGTEAAEGDALETIRAQWVAQ